MSLALAPYELDARHLGAIALAVASLENPGVAALPSGEPRTDLLKELVGCFTMRDMTTGQTPVVQRPSLRFGDQPLDERAQLLGFRLGCLDRPTLDQRLGQTPHQRELLLAGAAKLSANLTVTHP